MPHRGSNRRRNLWVVSLLDVQPADRVLEQLQSGLLPWNGYSW
ncbi:hypothetical protein [Actinomadura sp. HBU206391]|nr:hypothetical protein [Actinomadura sp. HBU206391]